MQPRAAQVRAFTSSYNRLSNVLANKVQIGPAFDSSLNQPPPTSAEFVAIWDTGATSSVITSTVVRGCGLKPISMAKVHTASGEHVTPVYLVSILLPNNVAFSQIRVTEGTIAGEAEVLVGMDIIGQGDFAVSNRDGKTVFSFRVPSLERIDFVKQQPATIVDNTGTPMQRVGRNEPCPCGSGKKYKRCCGQLPL